MLAVMKEYLGECHRQRVQPYEGFINRLSLCEIDTDIDDASPASIRVFAIALCRVGLNHQPKSSNKGARRGDAAAADTRRLRSKGFAGRTEEKADAPAASSSDSESRLVSLCIRYGNRGAATSSSAARVRRTDHQQQQVRVKSRSSIVDLVHRRILRDLIEGLRHAVEASQGFLTKFEFSGFPLSELPESGERLLRSLAMCPRLRILRLSRSPLILQQFSGLTSVPSSLPQIQEVALAECDLTDACRRGLQSLVCLGRGGEVLSSWQRSLRTTDNRPHQQHNNGHYPVTGLEKMDVSGNALGDATLIALASVIRQDSCLRTLDISRNAVTVEGLRRFVESGALEHSALMAVDLSRNPCSTNTSASVGGSNDDGPHSVVLPYDVRSMFRCLQYGLGQLVLVRQQDGDTPAARAARRCPPAVRVDSPDLLSMSAQGGIGAVSSSPSERLNSAPIATPHSLHYTAVPHSQAFLTNNTGAVPFATLSAVGSAPQQTAVNQHTLPGAAVPTSNWAVPAGTAPAGTAPTVIMVPYPVCSPFPMNAEEANAQYAMMMKAYGQSLPTAAAAGDEGAPMHRGGRSGAAAATAAAARSIISSEVSAPSLSMSRGTPQSPPRVDGLQKSLITEVIEPPPADYDEAVEVESPSGGDGGDDAAYEDPHLTAEALLEETAGPMTTHNSEERAEDATASVLLAHQQQHKAFLSLMDRVSTTLEHQEMELTERLDRQHQQSTQQIESFRKDIAFKFNKLSEAQREAAAAAAQDRAERDRQQKDMEQRRLADPDAQLMDQLLSLIQSGMARIQEHIGPSHDDQADNHTIAGRTRPPLLGDGRAGIRSEEGAARVDFLKDVNSQLKQLGW